MKNSHRGHGAHSGGMVWRREEKICHKVHKGHKGIHMSLRLQVMILIKDL